MTRGIASAQKDKQWARRKQSFMIAPLPSSFDFTDESWKLPIIEEL